MRPPRREEQPDDRLGAGIGRSSGYVLLQNSDTIAGDRARRDPWRASLEGDRRVL